MNEDARRSTSRPMLIDSHCHLDFPDLAGDAEGVVARARAAGVARLITISTRVRRFAGVVALLERFDEVYGSVGTHCHHAAEEEDVTLEEIVALAAHRKIVAIGEAGLDYHYDFSKPAAQMRGFRKHIAAARQTGLPLVVHARDADNDVATVLEEEMRRAPFKAVLHCFSSGADVARRGVAIGCYVSFSGILTFKKSEELRAIARSLPLDRLLVETDAPYLAPMPFRGKRNEPAFVVHTARILAESLGLPDDELAELTTQNALTLFDRMPGPINPSAMA